MSLPGQPPRAATRFGIRLRNLLFGALTAFGPLMKVVDRPARNIVLEDYERRGAVAC